jgi:Lysophospholipase L1 and related esterases
MKRHIAVILIVVILTALFSINVYSEELQNTSMENELQNIGIIKGSEHGFELDKEMTRIEAAAMMVRMLGNQDNRNDAYKYPFKDVPDWASAYIGFLYSNNYIKGLDENNFGSNTPISPNEYLVLMLRSLGYAENKDFTYDKVFEFCGKINLITADDYKRLLNSKFTRKDAFYITYRTLISKLPDSSEFMIQKLSRGNFTIRMGLKKFDGGKYYDKSLLSGSENELIDLWNLQTTNKTDVSSYDPQSRPVIFLGDSLTEGLTMINTFEGFNILNKGVNGNTVEKMFDRLNTDVITYNPKIVFIMAGTNNLWGGDDIDSIIKSYDKILLTIKTVLPDCKVYVQQNIPFGKLAYDNNPAITLKKFQNYNVRVQQLSAKYGYEYLFIGDLYKDENGLLNQDITKDGVHLKLEYYNKWIDVIKNLIG